ncbi:MAG: M48 family metalloprotease [Thermodesulfobacteriota bacterium]
MKASRGRLWQWWLLVGLGLLAGCAVNPVTGQPEVMLMGEGQEIRAGQESYPIYTQMGNGLVQDRQLQDYVQQVGSRLAAVSHRPNLAYEFNVVNTSEMNAYALPGGKISITRGLISRMENEAELAAVLGHEIGHVTARHSAQGYTREVFVGLLANAGSAALQTAGVRGGDILVQGGLVASKLVLLSYDRDQERQSDELGMDYMARAGYNPEGGVTSMEILLAGSRQEPSKMEAFLSSHPLTSERVETARRQLRHFPAVLRSADRLQAGPFQAATSHLRAVAPAYSRMDEGVFFLSQGKPGDALAALEVATRIAPGEAIIWVQRALAEARLKRTAEAFDSAATAVRLYPDLFHARYAAGVLAFDLDRFRDSLEHLVAADRLVPGQPQVAFFMGRCHEEQGQRERAARLYRTVLAQVRQGPVAEYCYRRLVSWGYLQPRR